MAKFAIPLRKVAKASVKSTRLPQHRPPNAPTNTTPSFKKVHSSSSSISQQSNIWNSHSTAKNGNSTDAHNVCNVKVIVRCRPLMPNELNDKNNHRIVETKVETKEVVIHQKYSKTYNFDAVCGPLTSQKELFDTYVVPTIDEVLMGFNCTIFAYGQTGTGKTHTMEGDENIYLTNSPKSALYLFNSEKRSALSPDTLGSGESAIDNTIAANAEADMETLNPAAGITPRAVHRIFYELESMKTEYSVRVSYLEIYNEELRDLLTESEPLKLRMFDEHGDSGKKGVAVDKLEELHVNNPKDIFSILSQAVRRRQTAATYSNERSSRSHCIFTIVIHMKETNTDGEDVIKIGKLNLVDLAGSENAQRNGYHGVRDRQKEAGMINQSLLTLGRVINALVDNSKYIPYRDSKLTRLLQDSLGGRTKTCIVATISPSSLAVEETFNTLDYAFRAKNIRNKPEVNQKMTKRVMIREMSQEIERLKIELLFAREKNGVYLPYERYKEMEHEITKKTMEINDFMASIAPLQEQKNELEKQNAVQLKELDDMKQHNIMKDKEIAALIEKHAQVDNVLDRTAKRLQEEAYVSKMLEMESQSLNENYQLLFQKITMSMETAHNLKAALESQDSTQETKNNILQDLANQFKESSSKLEKVEEEFLKVKEEDAKLLTGSTKEMQTKLSEFPDLICIKSEALNCTTSNILLEFFDVLEVSREKIMNSWDCDATNGTKGAMNEFVIAYEELKKCKESCDKRLNDHFMTFKELIQAERAAQIEHLSKAEAKMNELNEALSVVLFNLKKSLNSAFRKRKEEVDGMKNQLDNFRKTGKKFAQQKSEELMNEVKNLVENYGNTFIQKFSEDNVLIENGLLNMEDQITCDSSALEDGLSSAVTEGVELKKWHKSNAQTASKFVESMLSKLSEFSDETMKHSREQHYRFENAYADTFGKFKDNMKLFMKSGEGTRQDVLQTLENIKKSCTHNNEALIDTFLGTLAEIEQHVTGEMKPIHEDTITKLKCISETIEKSISGHQSELKAQNSITEALERNIANVGEAEQRLMIAVESDMAAFPAPSAVKTAADHRLEYNTDYATKQLQEEDEFQMSEDKRLSVLSANSMIEKGQKDITENDRLLFNASADTAYLEATAECGDKENSATDTNEKDTTITNENEMIVKVKTDCNEGDTVEPCGEGFSVKNETTIDQTMETECNSRDSVELSATASDSGRSNVSTQSTKQEAISKGITSSTSILKANTRMQLHSHLQRKNIQTLEPTKTSTTQMGNTSAGRSDGKRNFPLASTYPSKVRATLFTRK